MSSSRSWNIKKKERGDFWKTKALTRNEKLEEAIRVKMRYQKIIENIVDRRRLFPGRSIVEIVHATKIEVPKPNESIADFVCARQATDLIFKAHQAQRRKTTSVSPKKRKASPSRPISVSTPTRAMTLQQPPIKFSLGPKLIWDYSTSDYLRLTAFKHTSAKVIFCSN